MLKNKFFILMAALFTVSLFSCTTKPQNYSIISRLGEIDVLIQQGNTKDAMTLLKQAEKYAMRPIDVVGIYRRYNSLGENSVGQKLLERAIKKNPKSPELNALYTHVLLRQEKIDEAYKHSQVLRETEYASLYSEALFSYALYHNYSADEVFNPPKKNKKNKKNAVPQELKDNFYLDKRFIPAYIYAYNGSGASIWLENAACLYMRDGEFEKASLLRPEKFPLVKDSYFWGCVLFDSSRYADSVQALVQNKDSWRNDEYSVKSIALLSDDYYILGEDAESEEVRSVLFTMEMDDKALLAYEKILPVIYLNSAIYSRSEDDVEHEYMRLKFLVDEFPLYEPGLASYCQLAIDTINRPEEEALSKKLREAGLRTQAMERRDALPVVELSDALARVDDAVRKNNSSDLQVLKENVYAITHRDESVGQKQVRLWKLLEANENGTNSYPEEIVHHSVFKLIKLNQVDDAEAMFNEYLNAEYAMTLKDIEEFAIPDRFASWEYQAAAWFLKDRNLSKARSIYEYMVQRFNERNPRTRLQSQNDAVINALVNLGVIYEGSSMKRNALEVLNDAQGRCVDGNLKSEILFRMAKIQMNSGQESDAIQSLRYALALNEDHNKARLLLKQLTNIY